MKSLSQYLTESLTEVADNTNKIDSESEFREYAKQLLKNAHGDNYDESKAKKMIDDLIKKYGDDDEWGDAVGVLQNSLAQ